MQHAFCVDLEDYYHINFTDNPSGRESSSPSRLVLGTRRLLDVLERTRTYATFFVVTDVVAHNETLIHEIVARGHELGCHTHSHRLLGEMTPSVFAAELRHSCDALKESAGVANVRGFRAPSWSLNEQTLWALDELKDAGFEYDASMLPLEKVLFLRGMKDCPCTIHRLSNGLIEFPASVTHYLGMGMPFSLATFFRLMPYAYTRLLIRRFQRQEGMPVVMNIHPWELDENFPLQGISRVQRILLRGGMRGLERKLEKLLNEFDFGRMVDVLNEHEWLS